jgi:hypothetical protein
MAKDLKTILAGVKSSKKEKMDLSDWEKSKDGQAFAGKHEIEKHADRVGNTKHPYEGGKEAAYKKQKDSVYESSKMKCESCGKMYEGAYCESCGDKSNKKKLLLSGKKGLSEVLTKKTSAGEVISDFVHSKNPKFAGKSKSERTKMALGAYYGMHPEKSKKMEEEADFEFDMARNELATADRAISRLMTHLKGEGQLEAWVQSKITKGSDYLDTVADYMDSKMNEESELNEMPTQYRSTAGMGKNRGWASAKSSRVPFEGPVNYNKTGESKAKNRELIDKLSPGVKVTYFKPGKAKGVKEELAFPMLEDGKKKKGKPRKEERESSPSDGQVDLTSGNYPSGNVGDTGRV